MLHFREFPLLNTPNLFLLLLQTARDGASRLDDCAARLNGFLDAVHEAPPVSREEVLSRLDALRAQLTEARLLAPVSAERFEITERGRRALAEHPSGFDTADLMVYPEFAAYVRARRSVGAPMDPHRSQYEEGFAAYGAGATLADNPCPPETVDHQAWENGWCEALDEDAA